MLSVPRPVAVDNTLFPPEKLRIASFGKSKVKVAQLLAATVRTGIGVLPIEFVTPTHSIAPVVPPSAPKGVPAETLLSRHPAPTCIGLSV